MPRSYWYPLSQVKTATNIALALSTSARENSILRGGHRLRRDAIHALNHRNVSRLIERALKAMGK
jgi:hypothetical protein